MKTVKAGDKSKAICNKCECVVETTFMKRDVALSDNSAIVENLLVAVCNNCNAVVAMPQQSSIQVNHAITNEKVMARRDRDDVKNKSVTSVLGSKRLPQELEELEVGEMTIVDGKAFMRVDVEIANNEKELN